MAQAVQVPESCPIRQLESVEIPVSGLCLSGLLGHPTEEGRLSGTSLIFIHGFAAEKRENGLFEHIAARVMDEGCTVLLYDWRGLGESQGYFPDTNLAVHANDLLSVAQWFEATTGIATASTGAVGFSLGATLLAIGFQKGLPFRELVFLSPALRPALSMWPRYDTADIRQEVSATGYYLKNGVRVGQGMLDSLRDTDLGVHSLKYPVPLLVCHGNADARIPISGTREAFGRVGASDVLFAEFRGASHSFQPRTEHWQGLVDLILDWLTHDERPRGKVRKSFPPGDATHRRQGIRSEHARHRSS